MGIIGNFRRGSLVLGLLGASGCVENTLTVTTSPPGAQVWLNDQMVGRTPFTRDVTWAGNYEVIIRREGYQTVRTSRWLTDAFWLQPPIDLFANIAPWTMKDHTDWHFDLKPEETLPFEDLLDRAQEMKNDLQSSEYTTTRPAATRPTTRTTRPATKPRT